MTEVQPDEEMLFEKALMREVFTLSEELEKAEKDLAENDGLKRSLDAQNAGIEHLRHYRAQYKYRLDLTKARLEVARHGGVVWVVTPGGSTQTVSTEGLQLDPRQMAAVGVLLDAGKPDQPAKAAEDNEQSERPGLGYICHRSDIRQ